MAAAGNSLLIYACLAATWIIWGSTYLGIKFALLSFPPFYQMGTRFLVAGSLLLGVMRWRGRSMPTRIEWRNAFIIGGLMLGTGMGCTALSEVYVASGLVVAFIAIMPAVIAIMGLFFGVRPSRLEVLGMAIGFVGVMWLVRGGGFSASLYGLLAVSTAVCGWSLGSVLSIHKFKLAPGAVGFASEMLCGSVVLLVASGLTAERPTWPPQPLAAWAWVYLVVFGSLFAFNAYMILLARSTPALAASYGFVNPIIAMLLGVWFGHEVVTAQEWLAAGIVIVGVVLLVLGRRRKSASMVAVAAELS